MATAGSKQQPATSKGQPNQAQPHAPSAKWHRKLVCPRLEFLS